MASTLCTAYQIKLVSKLIQSDQEDLSNPEALIHAGEKLRARALERHAAVVLPPSRARRFCAASAAGSAAADGR